MVANTRRNKDIRKAVDNLIRVVHNTANSEGETLIAGITALVLVTAFQATVVTVFLV